MSAAFRKMQNCSRSADGVRGKIDCGAHVKRKTELGNPRRNGDTEVKWNEGGNALLRASVSVWQPIPRCPAACDSRSTTRIRDNSKNSCKFVAMKRPLAAKVAVIGERSSGKSLFVAALSGLDYNDVANGKVPSPLEVPVPDARLMKLNSIYKEPKVVELRVEVEEAQPISIGGVEAEKNAAIFNAVRDADAYLCIIPAYDISDAAEIGKTAAKKTDGIRSELLISDIASLENRIKKLSEMSKKPTPTQKEDIAEKETLEKILHALNEGKNPGSLEITPDIERRLRGYQLFSRKPVLSVLNVSDAVHPFDSKSTDIAAPLKLCDEYAKAADADKEEYKSIYSEIPDLRLTVLPKVTSQLSMITFFTVGGPECAAWPLKKGGTALHAAGKIHTDIAKGFIAAETFNYSEVAGCSTEKEAHAKAKVRLEGKEYIMKDGDIVNFRFGR